MSISTSAFNVNNILHVALDRKDPKQMLHDGKYLTENRSRGLLATYVGRGLNVELNYSKSNFYSITVYYQGKVHTWYPEADEMGAMPDIPEQLRYKNGNFSVHGILMIKNFKHIKDPDYVFKTFMANRADTFEKTIGFVPELFFNYLFLSKYDDLETRNYTVNHEHEVMRQYFSVESSPFKPERACSVELAKKYEDAEQLKTRTTLKKQRHFSNQFMFSMFVGMQHGKMLSDRDSGVYDWRGLLIAPASRARMEAYAFNDPFGAVAAVFTF